MLSGNLLSFDNATMAMEELPNSGNRCANNRCSSSGAWGQSWRIDSYVIRGARRPLSNGVGEHMTGLTDRNVGTGRPKGLPAKARPLKMGARRQRT